MYYLSIVVFLTLILSGCRQYIEEKDQSQDQSLPSIDFTMIEKSPNELKASSLFSKIKYIHLETRSECYLGQGRIRYIDSSQIIILSESELYRFSINGAFLNKIGRKGKGPKEYIHPSSVFFDRDRSLFTIVELKGKRTLSFTPSGEFIKEDAININLLHKNTFEFCYIDNRHILESIRHISNEKKVRDELYIINQKGDVLFSYFDKYMNGAKKIAFYHFPSRQFSSSEMFVTLPFNDTIFSVSAENGFNPIMVQNLGNKRMPRNIAEDFVLNKRNREKYITGGFSLITSKYVFSKFYLKNAKYVFVFDLGDKKVIGYEKLSRDDLPERIEEFGIKDDINDGSNAAFFPTYTNKNMIYDLSYSKFENKKMSDNPTVVVGYLK